MKILGNLYSVVEGNSSSLGFGLALGLGPRAPGPVGPLIAAARHWKLLYNIIAAVVGFLAAVIVFLAAVKGKLHIQT